jgi:pimeloyl-ACP methyl ester carboxylesterase
MSQEGKPVQVQQHRAEINGQQLKYLQAGSGPPVLLVHGLLGGSFCWRFNIPAFARNRTVLALDLPGFGESDAPRHLDCSMPAQTERLAHLLDHLAFNQVDIVGSSWGGAVAILLAACSSRVRSLVLAAPVNPWSASGARRVRFLSGWAGGTLLRLMMPALQPLHPLALRRMYGDPARIPAATLEGYSALLMRRGRVHNILNTLRSWEKDLIVLRPAIAQVKAPCLLIWGTRDGAVDPRSSEELMRALPGCERALIEGAGHLPFEETPDEFNRLALDFLGRVSPAT